MYDRVETDASLRYLHRLVDELRTDYCLIGGWAVHYTVKDAYENEVGRPYLGSRDIDIGLPDVTSFKKAERYILGDLRFERVSFRYLRHLDHDTGKEVPTEDARQAPMYMLIPMYIDAMLPRAGKDVTEQLGFTPPDEPLLGPIFHDRDNTQRIQIDGRTVRVPRPQFLIAMKINAMGNRTMDHKKVKDICDLAALCLYGGKDMGAVVRESLTLCDPEKLQRSKAAVTSQDLAQVAATLDIPKDIIGALLERFGIGKKGSADRQ